MNLYDSVMSTKQNKSNSDRTLKRVHTDVSDFSSSDEESRKSSKSVKKSKLILPKIDQSFSSSVPLKTEP